MIGRGTNCPLIKRNLNLKPTQDFPFVRLQQEKNMYEEIHCPFCGGTNITCSKEGFNFKAAFWGALFLSLWGILFGVFCRKRTKCKCSDCGREFSYYE
jgi:hypothetical protein